MKSDRPFLQHMLDAVVRVEVYLKDVTHRQFLENQEKHDAVIRQLEILGEAAGRVSSDTVRLTPKCRGARSPACATS